MLFSSPNQHPAIRKQPFPEHLWPDCADPNEENECWAFLWFARAAHLHIECKPTKKQPPSPDLECSIDGDRVLFEVSEILEESLGQGLAHSAEQSVKKCEAVSRGDKGAASSILTVGSRFLPKICLAGQNSGAETQETL